MKKTNLLIACSIALGGLAACNSGSDASNSTTSDSNSTTSTNTTTTGTTTGTGSDTGTGSTATNTNTTANATPLKGQDSTFAMKAAMGGMMEVESSNAALQNATNDRVKAYANMMVNDHTKANQELMSLASAKGFTLPTALPADKQKHIDEMKKMQGKSFDRHYVDMMMNDHKKDVAEFEKQANNGSDPDLKAWAAKTLPTLKMHRDSIQSISKAKM